MLFRSMWVFVLVVTSVPKLAPAQSVDLSRTDNASDASDSKDELTITGQKLKELTPSYPGRFARAFQFTYSTLEQPGTALIQNPNGSSTFVPNPERYLNKLSLNFQFSELFLTSSDLKTLIKTYTEHFAGFPQAVKDGKPIRIALCGTSNSALNDPVHCIATGGGLWRRLLSATTLSFSLSERQRVASQVIVADKPFPQDYDKVGEVDFNPAQLFVSATNVRDGIDALSGLNIGTSATKIKNCPLNYLDDIRDINPPSAKPRGDKPKDVRPLTPDQKKCIIRLPLMSTKVIIASILIPTFQFKRQSQFDFVRSAGVLIPSPFAESALNSYTFTWDLRRVIAPTKIRSDAVAAMTQGYSGKNLTNEPNPEMSKACVTKAAGVTNLITVNTNMPPSVCQTIARDLSADQYGLACISDTIDKGTLVATTAQASKPPKLDCHW